MLQVSLQLYTTGLFLRFPVLGEVCCRTRLDCCRSHKTLFEEPVEILVFLLQFLNPFSINVPIPPENIRNIRSNQKHQVFWCFQGVEKWNIGWKLRRKNNSRLINGNAVVCRWFNYSNKLCETYRKPLSWGSLRPIICDFILRSTPMQMLTCEFCEFFQNICFAKHYWLTAPINANEINPFSTSVALLYLLKITKNLGFSDVFRWYRSGTLVKNRLM